MSIEKCVSPIFKVREDLNNKHGNRTQELRSLRTFAFFFVRRAIDIKVLTDLNGIFHPRSISEMQAAYQQRLTAQNSHILEILQILAILLQTTKGKRAIDIKGLTDLRLLFCPACYRH